MTDTIAKVSEHYSATSLTDRIKSALAAVTPDDQTLTVAQFAPLDQFNARGILATAGVGHGSCTRAIAQRG